MEYSIKKMCNVNIVSLINVFEKILVLLKLYYNLKYW